ncbi:MAG TPA: DUF1269 domain-containing protein [Longimicrobium sp.]|jgi:uncharacterized membrane protein|nr:DUF1269 domain-containing protein [Longimicrobium sp.]
MADEPRRWHLAKYEVLLFSFDGVSAARDALTELKEEHQLEEGHVLAEALVSHQHTGKVHVHDPGAAGPGGAMGAVAGGFIAMFAGPVALPFLLVAGGLMGGVAGHLAGRVLPRADLGEVAAAMPLGTSAYVALVEHDDAPRLTEIFAARGARVIATPVDSEMAGVLGHALAEKVSHAPAGPPDQA